MGGWSIRLGVFGKLQEKAGFRRFTGYLKQQWKNHQNDTYLFDHIIPQKIKEFFLLMIHCKYFLDTILSIYIFSWICQYNCSYRFGYICVLLYSSKNQSEYTGKVSCLANGRWSRHMVFISINWIWRMVGKRSGNIYEMCNRILK